MQKKILDFRAKNNLTQKQLSEIFGVSALMIHKYEASSSKPSSKNKIIFENKMKEWEEKKNESL